MSSNKVTLPQRFSNWQALQEHAHWWQSYSLSEAFQEDNNRADRYSVTASGLYYDYSKTHINDVTVNLLLETAEQSGLTQAIKRLLRGDHVNNTENRPALHTALRQSEHADTEENTSVQQTLAKMSKLVDAVHSGNWKGHQGDRITDVINIGIGGSDLGPRMVVKALTPFHTGHVKVHFVANIDGAEINDLMNSLNPATSLFLIASKSFSTLETLQNALTARNWLLENQCQESDLAKHFVAISSKVDKAVEFGIAAENVYPLWDWVGGRYSLWSAIGLPIAMAVGMDHFNSLRAGAMMMDNHFSEAPLDRNIPVLMGLLAFWYGNVLGADTQAILPYVHHLQLLPSYLQQLEMESNGKSTNRDGSAIAYQTGAIVWGTEETNGQHSFHQLLHQGTKLVPVDFISTLRAQHKLDHQHRLLYANCLAQSQALMTGRDLKTSEDELRAQGVSDEDIGLLAPHKVHPGNRPSTTLIMQELNPQSLGSLIAAYEHKVYVLSVLWDINAFDQWGVELGKLLGTHVATAIETTDIPSDWDSSTQALVKMFTAQNKGI